MRWFRENTDLIAIALVALAVTAEPPMRRVHFGPFTERRTVAGEIKQAIRDARGEIRRTLRTSLALHRYND